MDIWCPTPKQKIVYDAQQTYIHCFGDPRSGKSEGLFQKARKEALRQPGIKILITRDTGTSLSLITLEHFLSKILEPRLIIGGLHGIKQKPFPHFTLKNGSQFFFIPYDEMDTTKAGGSEYGIILIEEAHRFSLRQYVYMDTRISQQWGWAIGRDGKRYKNAITYNGLWSTSNPAGRGYLYRIFRRDHPLAYVGTDPTHLGMEFYLKDNEQNLKASYIGRLNNYSESIKKEFLGANEDPMQGLCFPDFDREINVCKISDFLPPSNWKIIGGKDMGFQTPTVFLWMAITEDAFCVYFKEYREILKTRKENVLNILHITDDLVLRGMQHPEMAWIDPSTNMQDGKTGSAKTPFELMREDGLTWLYTAKRVRVVDRIIHMRDLLKPDPNKKRHPITGEIRAEGWPTMIFTEDCEETIKEFEEWEFEQLNTERKDPKGKPQEKCDHGPDAAYYCLNSYFGYGVSEHDLTIAELEKPPEVRTKKAIDKVIQDGIDQRDKPQYHHSQSGAVF